jgi:hypothetical protein
MGPGLLQLRLGRSQRSQWRRSRAWRRLCFHICRLRLLGQKVRDRGHGSDDGDLVDSDEGAGGEKAGLNSVLMAEFMFRALFAA